MYISHKSYSTINVHVLHFEGLSKEILNVQNLNISIPTTTVNEQLGKDSMGPNTWRKTTDNKGTLLKIS